MFHSLSFYQFSLAHTLKHEHYFQPLGLHVFTPIIRCMHFIHSLTYFFTTWAIGLNACSWWCGLWSYKYVYFFIISAFLGSCGFCLLTYFVRHSFLICFHSGAKCVYLRCIRRRNNIPKQTPYANFLHYLIQLVNFSNHLSTLSLYCEIILYPANSAVLVKWNVKKVYI